jgi:peptidyl-prolyl cis-trans isomerase SurA
MKQLFLFIISSFSFFITIAQPQRVVADKIVAVVGDKIVLKSDLENSMNDMQRQGMDLPENARCLILEQALGVKALVLQAEKDSLPVTDEEVETEIDNQIRGFITQYGSKDELERIAGKTIYQLKEDYKEGFKDRKLAQAMRNKIVGDVRITPNEVRAFYEKIPKDSLFLYESELELSQIVNYPKASRDAEEYCIEQLKEAKEQIETGKKTFAAVAEKITMDPGSKDRGGQYEINRNSRELDPIWLNKAFTLKEGQISNPFKTRFGYHILQLVSRSGDDAVVRHILLIPQVTSIEMKQGVEKLDSIRAKLIAGTISFGEAVNKYSDDEGSKFNAGAISARDGSNYLTIDQLDPALVTLLKDLKVGKYSQPVEFTDDRGKKGIRIVHLKSKTEPHKENLKDDYDRVATRALEDKKNDILEAWFAKKIPTYYITIDDELKSCPEMSKWLIGIK